MRNVNQYHEYWLPHEIVVLHARPILKKAKTNKQTNRVCACGTNEVVGNAEQALSLAPV